MLNRSFAGRPGLCGPAATGITAARPGHDCDCAQAPVRLVACRAAGSRLVVSKISWLSTEAHSERDKSCCVADHGYDTQRNPRHRHSPILNAERAAGPG